MASDATPRCASMASADRQMIGDATLVCCARSSPGAWCLMSFLNHPCNFSASRSRTIGRWNDRSIAHGDVAGGGLSVLPSMACAMVTNFISSIRHKSLCNSYRRLKVLSKGGMQQPGVSNLPLE
ncbi:hypothetical protein Veis_3087 [Verminephrobacter eiseniae EF01-2]|uniref:Uncharacterized protein n=1 Tax=Verminephrobacter eiseniae (strain EF01-2) TaxID=391735 RepID=A1WMG3_VEREI|nr:hypothetical protein Veis_3087 [Verminephrobacter eiseniae EF01-2]